MELLVQEFAGVLDHVFPVQEYQLLAAIEQNVSTSESRDSAIGWYRLQVLAAHASLLYSALPKKEDNPYLYNDFFVGVVETCTYFAADLPYIASGVVAGWMDAVMARLQVHKSAGAKTIDMSVLFAEVLSLLLFKRLEARVINACTPIIRNTTEKIVSALREVSARAN